MAQKDIRNFTLRRAFLTNRLDPSLRIVRCFTGVLQYACSALLLERSAVLVISQPV